VIRLVVLVLAFLQSLGESGFALGLTKEHTNEYYPGTIAQEAHRSLATVKLAWGALGTAKTTWGCWRLYFLAERAALSGYSLRALVMRDTYRNLADSTLQTWLYWFKTYGEIAHSNPVDFRLHVGGKDHDILFRHGQTEQDASQFLSTEYDVIFLEEIAPAYLPGAKKISPGISEGVFDMAYSRLTRELKRAQAIGPEMIMTCNSPPLNHWSSIRIIDKSPTYLKAVNWAHYNFPVSDNAENLRPDYYSNLELAWEGKEGLKKRFLRGERVAIFVGIPRFDLEKLADMETKAREPGFRGFLVDTDENILHIKVEANQQGWVKIWTLPRLGHQYVIGADVAEGVEGGDFSSAHVLDREDESIVASWHGHCEPERFGKEELFKLGRLYNNASIGVESNNHGLTTLTALRNANYPRIFYHKSLELRGRGQERMGWRADTKTKPMMIDGIGTYLESNPDIPDRELINELQTFGVMENGTCEAQEGCHDDRVTSLGIALVVNKVGGINRFFPSA
jgi:hypothetical protein